jgi:predicted ATPase
LLPELRLRYPDLPPPAPEPNLEPTLLCEAVVRLGQALARRKPLLFWIDNVQWAGAATRDLLTYATSRWSEAGTPVLVVVCSRAEDVRENPELRRWLAGLERDVRLSRLDVQPLRREDLVQLAGILAGEDVEGLPAPRVVAFGEWLAERTDGLPAKLSQALGELLADGALRCQMLDGSRWVVDIPEPAAS